MKSKSWVWWLFQVTAIAIGLTGVWLAWIWNELQTVIIFFILMWANNVSLHSYDNFLKRQADRSVKKFIDLFKID